VSGTLSNRKISAAAATLLLLLIPFALGACGGSSKGGTANAATTTSTTGGGAATPGAPGGGAGRFGARDRAFAARRECLEKNGITLPQRTPGQGPAAGRGLHLAAGVSREQFLAALRKCGGGRFLGGAGRFGGARRFDSQAFKSGLKKFAACMRENGINLPAPNTSGNGPFFNSKGLDTGSAQFKAAQAKCRADLAAGFPGRVPPGAPPGAPGGEAPPTG
jgi:hypothetical protein